jgi:deoxyribodipyrimidine photolyase-related protein
MSHAINQSLDEVRASHSELMVIGNFTLLTQIHPDEVDAWYLGVYIAIEWVEMPNTRGCLNMLMVELLQQNHMFPLEVTSIK